ncbi:MAG: translation elongation factor Ts [Acidobacteriota bacterium]|nr:translation elongation factor Ts [Acidobacteriota bacterium]MCZ6876947.1 translation elongation factor Ts [Acidobacteriota bacterium]
MAIAAEQVKALRDQTGAGMMECKKALVEADGDFQKAVTLLRERGLAAASKRADRETREGIIGHYIHAGGRLGVLLEVDCETDFVAGTDQFQELVRDLAMQIAASSPSFVRREDVSQEKIEKEKEIYQKQALAAGKPEKLVERIVEGKLNKYYSEVCLYEQPFIKDSDLTVEELIKSIIAIVKENISVKRFARFKVGE